MTNTSSVKIYKLQTHFNEDPKTNCETFHEFREKRSFLKEHFLAEEIYVSK